MRGAPAPGAATAGTPGVDRARIAAAVVEILAAIGEDPGRAGLASTPQRVADAYAEFFSGLRVDPVTHLTDGVPVDGRLGELVLMRDIEFRSVCEHHLLPFSGVAHLAYVPRERVVGLGRLARVVDTLAARPQLQEHLTEQVADTLQEGLDPLGVLVVLDAIHACVSARGTRQSHSSTVTMASRGSLSDPDARNGVLALLGEARSVRAQK
ncbi:GTP cyclohydrolase I FolE [Parafrigoribacterium mesophilum]|uniref:GTP cyclohydrolase I FolE n=1 Tax=Parafrigoribacterium mesophilum TaxID=433646 RepID=UPI0031FCBBB0